MKKLKVYQKCDFRLIEVYSGPVADQLIQTTFIGNVRPNEGDQRPGTDPDPNPGGEIWGEAPGARGLWDE